MSKKTKNSRKAKSKSAVDTSADVREMREFLLQMVRDGAGEDAIDALLDLVLRLRQDNTMKTLKIAKLLRARFGSTTEKLSRQQLDLFLKSIAEGELADDDDELADLPEIPKQPKRKRKRTGRNPLPSSLPREVFDHHPTEQERRCDCCAVDKSHIGYDSSELLDFVPAKLVVHEHRRHKYACPKCESGVVIAPVVDKPIEGGRPTEGLLAHVAVAKFEDHLPLYRQVEQFKRQGVTLPRSTLGSWMAYVANIMTPIFQRIVQQVLAAEVLGVDDTTIKVQDRSKKPAIKRGHIWSYVGYKDGVPMCVCYDYTPTWEGTGPREFMGERVGFIQGDGYKGLDEFFRENLERIRVGCWAHARRKFKDALDGKELRAAKALKLIGRMYQVERIATDRGLSTSERQKLRDELARPTVVKLKRWLVIEYARCRPTSLLFAACRYAINQWATLMHYLDDGRVAIDNNQVENRMRPVAVGRKNWLFAGSDAAGKRTAILLTVLASAKLAGHDRFAYLRSVIGRISRGWPQSRLDELLPANWQPDADAASA